MCTCFSKATNPILRAINCMVEYQNSYQLDSKIKIKTVPRKKQGPIIYP